MLCLQHRSLQHNLDAQEKEMQKKEEEHQAEVSLLKEDLARAARLNEWLKQDLELVLRDKGIAEKQHDDLKIAMSKRGQDDKKTK